MSDEPDRPDDDDPFAALFGSGMGGLFGADGANPAQLGEMLQRIGALLSSGDGGPVAWDLALDAARRAVDEASPTTAGPAMGFTAGIEGVTAADRAAVDEAVRLADVWLDPVTVFPSPGGRTEAWTRREWIDRTLPAWKGIVEPLAGRASEAFSQVLPDQLGGVAPEGAAAFTAPMAAMAQRMGAAVFGMQVGEGLGQLAQTVLSTGDVSIPLAPQGTIALVPANISAFSEGLGVSEDDVRVYLALRAAAHARLVAHAPWLASRFASAVEDYARGINVDTSAIEESMRAIDPSDPAALQSALESGMFQPADTPQQTAALARIETLLALVEGWVDDVVSEAATAMPSAIALRETLQRRRATGGPAEQTFAALVGLELRPRRLRDAAALWQALREQRGAEGREALWAHPDLLPTSDDLDDPQAFLSQEQWDISGLEGLESFNPDESKDDEGDSGPSETA